MDPINHLVISRKRESRSEGTFHPIFYPASRVSEWRGKTRTRRKKGKLNEREKKKEWKRRGIILFVRSDDSIPSFYFFPLCFFPHRESQSPRVLIRGSSFMISLSPSVEWQSELVCWKRALNRVGTVE